MLGNLSCSKNRACSIRQLAIGNREFLTPFSTMTITEDLLLGAKFTLDFAGGVLTRVFEVSGLAPGRDTLAQAAFAQDSATGLRIPSYGDSHPGVAGLFVSSIEADPLPDNPTSAEVRVRYTSPELYSVPNVAKVQI